MGENNNGMEGLRGALEKAFLNESGGNTETQENGNTSGQAQNAETATQGASGEGMANTLTRTDPPAEKPQETSQATVPSAPQAVPQQAPAQDRTLEMMRYLMAENQRLQAEQARQREAIGQQSELARNTIEGRMQTEATAPGTLPPTPAAMPEIPVINMEEFRYLSSEDQQKALMEWQKGVQEASAARTKAEVMAELAPMMRDYTANRETAAMAAARAKVNADARFSDFAGMQDQIDRVISSTPQLRGMEAEQRYMIGGLIARGMNGTAAPKQYSVNEIVEMASSNPEVMRALETRRVSAVDEANKNVPILAGSTGMASAAAVPENKPKTFDELRARIRSKMER